MNKPLNCFGTTQDKRSPNRLTTSLFRSEPDAASMEPPSFRLPGKPNAVALMVNKAEFFGQTQYYAVQNDWKRTTEGFGRLSTIESELVGALCGGAMRPNSGVHSDAEAWSVQKPTG